MAGTKDAAKRVGTLALAALLVVSMVGASGLAAAKTEMDGDNGDDGDGDVFTDEITVKIAGVTITLGPPQDPNDDGVFEDVTSDGQVNVIDGVAHAGLVAAVSQGAVDLNEEQKDALDVDGDGNLDFQDSIALAQMTFSGSMQ
ncbi:hypothetical protein BRC86_08190 [Halobacteriales archaeon QS_3_64_16]|nr:MAG: hypothetical protein BRC86_08190 [Halobacteriales archaeon QS_3_64_16]